MLPETPLPDAALVARDTNGAAPLGLRQRFREAALDQPPARGEIAIARRQFPDRMQMIRQHHERDDREGWLRFTVTVHSINRNLVHRNAKVDPTGLWGFGLLGSASVEGGAVVVGAGATASVGGGVFWGGSGGANYGAFGSGGAFAGSPLYGYSSPAPLPGGTTAALGGYGGGLGAYFTNATSVAGLKDVFNTYSLNTPIGSIQLGLSGDTFIVSVSGVPPVGAGVGFSLTTYPTNTVVFYSSK